jgi:hypothetical protein
MSGSTIIAAGATNASSDKASRAGDVGATLINLEKQSWVAWKAHDGAYFSSFLSDDHVDVSARGATDKANVVAGVAGPFCSVESYAVDGFQVTRLSQDAALLVYHAQQKTTCAGVPVPSPAWVSSLYIKRGGRWLNAVFQQTPTK